MIDVERETAAYLSSFERLGPTLLAAGGSWLPAVRKAALARFAEVGFPTTRDEAWRLTSVAPIASVPFAPAAAHDLDAAREAELGRATFGAWARHELVFVNGRWSERLSTPGAVPTGVRLASLASVLRDEPALVEPYLTRYAEYRAHAFRALNTAFIADGALVLLQAGVVLETPIHLVFVSSAPDGPTVSHPRSLVVAGAGSQATIVETYVGLGPGVYLTNAVTEVAAGEGAVVEHCKVQRESEEAFHVASLEVHQDRGSRVVSHSVSLGGALVRNDLDVVLAAEGSECVLNGLYLASGRQHVDTHTTIDHAAPHGTSAELYKGVLGGRAKGVFNGRIVVRPDAQKTDAQQANRNLLLSDDAVIDTKPELEIFANDVRCTHGAALGRLDPDALFYLRARGLDASAARRLLIRAFASDIIERIGIEPIRAALDELIQSRLSNGQSTRGAI